MKKQKIRHFFEAIKGIIPVIKKSCLILAIMGFIGAFLSYSEVNIKKEINPDGTFKGIYTVNINGQEQTVKLEQNPDGSYKAIYVSLIDGEVITDTMVSHTDSNSMIRYNPEKDKWEYTNNGTNWVEFGSGSGDMEKATYDTDDNGIVDNSESVIDNAITSAKIQDGTITETDLSFTPLNIDQSTPQTIENGVPLLDSTPNGSSDIKSIVNKEYVDLAVTSLGASYYMYSEVDGTGYRVCHLDPSSNSETYIEVSGLSDNQYIAGWISGTGEEPAKLLKGVYDWYITLEKITGNQELRIYWKLFERKSDNSEVEIATSSYSNVITDKSSYIIPLQLSEDYIPDENSRIVGKLYADVNGTGNAPTLRIYFQGSTSSRWEIPANTEIFKNIFVPYSGATQNIDLGDKNLTTTGTINAGILQQNSISVLTASTSFSGDVSGTYDNISVDKIKGIPVDNSNIADGYILVYDDDTGNLQYSPRIGTDWRFTTLFDTPSSYTGYGGKVVKVKETEDGLEFGDVSGGGFDYKTSFSYYSSSNLASAGEYLSDEILVDTGTLSSISNIYLLSSCVDTDTSVVYYELYKGEMTGYESSLKGFWKLEDTNWLDETDNNNDLTASASAPTIVSGQIGNAADFERDNSQYLYLSDKTKLTLENTDFTIAFWWKPETTNVEQGLVWKAVQGGDGYWVKQASDGRIDFTIAFNGSGTDSYSTSILTTGTWYHIVATFDTSTKEMKIYVNGTSETINTAGDIIDSNQSNSFYIGVDYVNSRYADGVIDEVVVWDRKLSDTEIQTLYEKGVDAVSNAYTYTTKIADLSAGQDNSVSITNDTGHYKLKVIGSSELDFRGFTMYFK